MMSLVTKKDSCPLPQIDDILGTKLAFSIGNGYIWSILLHFCQYSKLFSGNALRTVFKIKVIYLFCSNTFIFSIMVKFILDMDASNHAIGEALSKEIDGP